MNDTFIHQCTELPPRADFPPAFPPGASTLPPLQISEGKSKHERTQQTACLQTIKSFQNCASVSSDACGNKVPLHHTLDNDKKNNSRGKIGRPHDRAQPGIREHRVPYVPNFYVAADFNNDLHATRLEGLVFPGFSSHPRKSTVLWFSPCAKKYSIFLLSSSTCSVRLAHVSTKNIEPEAHDNISI